MAVFVDMLGGPTFPPTGTQAREFVDTFNRPDEKTLGIAWGTAWLLSDGHWQDTSRPGGFDCAVNPSIVNNACAWWTRRDGGIGFTIAWPWVLAWMSQGYVDQYSQFRVTFIQGPETNVQPELCLCYTGNPGTLTGGFYYLAVAGHSPTTVSLSITRAEFGFNPSGTPTGIPGDGGLRFFGVAGRVDDIPITSILRFEARRVNNAWNLRGLADNEVVIEGTDSSLGPGIPGMGASQYHVEGIQLNPLCAVDDYRAGLLPGSAIIPAPPPELPWQAPVDSQVDAVAENFVIYDGSQYVPSKSFRTGFSAQYLGSDSPNAGLLLSQQEPYALTFTPSGAGISGIPFQSGVVVFPWKLAWYTQSRHTHQSTGSVFNLDVNAPGLSAVSMLCCFSGNSGNQGQCYALTAATYTADVPHPILLAIQKWTFPNSPHISIGESPNTNWQNTTLLHCGNLLHNNARLFFIAADKQDHWQLSAYVVYNDNQGVPWQFIYMGGVEDDSIGPGMPAFAAIQFASLSPMYLRIWVGGQHSPGDDWFDGPHPRPDSVLP